MIRVVYQRFGQPDPEPTWLDGSVRAVPAEPFADVDSGEGGITRADIADESLIKTLDTFESDADVYVESEDETDALFDDSPEVERSSHIWWRATIVSDTQSAEPSPASPAKYTLDGEPVDLEAFLRDNAETFTCVDIGAARALQVGEEVAFGGGAWATFVLRRVE